MKKALAILFIGCCLSLYCFSQSIVIPSKEISWDNFKGRPTGEYFAETNSAMKISLVLDRKDSVVEYIVAATFNENLSYARKDLFSSYQKGYLAFLFQHEKYHYLITVVHCKKLVTLLRELENHSRISVMDLYYKIDRICRAQQELYDKETEHAFNIGSQKIWVTKIDEELLQLKDIRIPGE